MEGWVLVQFALEGAPVEVEAASGFRNVSGAFRENALDVLPFDAVEGGDFVGRIGVVGDPARFVERREDLVCVRRFGEVIDCAVSDGFEGGSDASVACEEDDLEVRQFCEEFFEDGESAEAGHF